MDIMGMAECESPMTKQASSPSLVDNLRRKQKMLQEQLGNVEAALKALEENPQVAQVIELVARAR